MKYLAAILLISLMPLESFSQVVVRNQSSKDVTTFVEEGLKELEVDSAYVIIMDLTPELYKKFSQPNHELNAVTMEKAENQYIIFLGNATETDMKTLVAHELIHVQQKFEGKRVTEQEAYARQVLVSQRIQERIGK